MNQGFRRLLRAKIHRLTVTDSDVDYEGSLTLPPDLLEAAGVAEYEALHVWDVTNGERIETYALVGETGSRTVCINGAAAHLIHPGDLIIVAAFGYMTDEHMRIHKPRLVFVNERNEIARISP